MQQYSLLLRKKKKPILKFCCLTCIKMETQKIANLSNDSVNES